MLLEMIYSLPNYVLLIVLWVIYISYALLGGYIVQVLMKNKKFKDAAALGAMGGLITTMFAILGAFVAIGALNTYRSVEALVQKEAADVSSIYNSAFALPDSLRKEIQENIFAYTQRVVNVEWNSMREEKLDISAQAYLDRILQQADKYVINNQVDSFIVTQIINRIFTLYEIHRQRADSVNASLEATTWVVLIIISIVAISLHFLYIMKSRTIRYIALSCMASVVASLIFLIIMYDHPYRGDIAISPKPIREVMDRISYGIYRYGVIDFGQPLTFK